MRRRSRSPLPEILRRQMHGPPRIPPDTMGGPAAYLLHEDEHIIPAKFEVRENFKEQCILYNEAYFCENGLDLGELGIEALFELEPQPMGEEKQDRVFGRCRTMSQWRDHLVSDDARRGAGVQEVGPHGVE